MSNDTKTNPLEALFKKLESDVRKLLEPLRDAPKQIEDLKARVTALEAEAMLTTPRLTALETETQTNLPQRIETATTEAKNHAQGIVDALSKAGGALFELDKKHEALATTVGEINNPKSAAEIAETRLPEYRAFNEADLKDALSKDRQDVLVEIVSLLDTQNNNGEDAKVFTNMLKLVDDKALKFELHAFAGSKVKR